MNSEIVKTLELMCDKNEPRDKKLLLLAELVESKCEALADNQAALKKGLDLTNEKVGQTYRPFGEIRKKCSGLSCV